MRHLVLYILLSAALLHPTAVAGQDFSAVFVAAGSDPTTTDNSARVLDVLLSELESQKIIAVRTSLRGSSSELTESAALAKARETRATGAVILQFQSTKSRPTAGYAYLWASTLVGPARRYIEYVDDLAGNLTGVARSLAAYVTSTISGGTYYLVELHIFTRPRDSFITIGQSRPVQPDRPGRQSDEGLYLWYGTRPAGTTAVTISKPPDYEEQLRGVQIPRTGAEPFRIPIVVQLVKKKGF